MSGQDSLPQALGEAATRVAARRPLLLFPEGARRSSALGAYKTGVGLLALELDLPVIPVRVDLAGSAADPSSSPRGARVHVGCAVRPEAFRSLLERLTPYEVYREIAEVVRRQIVALDPAADADHRA